MVYLKQNEVTKKVTLIRFFLGHSAIFGGNSCWVFLTVCLGVNVLKKVGVSGRVTNTVC